MKVRFKTRGTIGPIGKVVDPGEEAYIPDDHFNEAIHEKVEDEGETPSGESPSPTPSGQ